MTRQLPELAESAARTGALVAAVALGVATARGGRPRNEDAVGVDGWGLGGDPVRPVRLGFPLDPVRPTRLAVADGLGGAPDGQLAAWLAVQRLSSGTSAEPTGPDSVGARFAATDALLRAASGDTGMACTAALVQVGMEGRAVLAHVGDVRVYLVRDRDVTRLTEDHRAQPAGPAVTRCLGGVRTTAMPAVRTVRVRPGDRLVLCTDGVHDPVDPARFAAAVNLTPAHHAAAALVSAALASGHGDNATAAVLDLVGPTAPAPAGNPPNRARRHWWRGKAAL